MACSSQAEGQAAGAASHLPKSHLVATPMAPCGACPSQEVLWHFGRVIPLLGGTLVGAGAKETGGGDPRCGAPALREPAGRSTRHQVSLVTSPRGLSSVATPRAEAVLTRSRLCPPPPAALQRCPRSGAPGLHETVSGFFPWFPAQSPARACLTGQGVSTGWAGICSQGSS